MPGTRAEQEYAARYAALYREHNAQLIAYARSLTGSATMAEDLAAEAHFRVWRRIQAGHEVQNVAAYLTTTVRNLAAGLGRAQREIARDVAELPEDPARAGVHQAVAEDPEQRASHVDLISRLLKELPDRWAKALWYAEVEDLPLEAVGERIGASAGTAAVLLNRARERLRQAFLQSQPGTPLSGDCEPYWKQMATIVRGTASARRTKSVTEHCDECADCRSRMLALTEANTRLPALLGPAVLAAVLGGGAWFARIGAAGTGAAAGTAVHAGRAGSRVARHARIRITARARLVRHGLTPTKSVLLGSVAAVGIAATVATIALGSTDKPNTAPHASARQAAPAAVQPTAAASTVNAATPAAPASSSAATTGTTTAQSPAARQSTVTTPAAANPAAVPMTSSATSAATQTSAIVAAPTTATPAPAASSNPASSAATSAAAATPSASATYANPVQSNSPTAAPTLTPTSPSTPTATPSPTDSDVCYVYVLGLCIL
jgi:RNA polymerase sigma factor (sigma-70 family)